MRGYGFAAAVSVLAVLGCGTVLPLHAQTSTSEPAAPQTTPPAQTGTETAPKDADRLPSMNGSAPEPAAPSGGTGTTEPPPAPGATEDGAIEDPDSVLPNLEGNMGEDDVSVGEIPLVETVELTDDMAKKALDAYVLVREKYKDAALENYENLQDFVDQTEEGKAFDADIKTFGFKTVNEWNIAITSVGFAYSNIVDDQTADIKSQIEEIKQDSEMAQDMRDRMVAALTAMIPSPNNHKVVENLINDPAYKDKVKLLETEEEDDGG